MFCYSNYPIHYIQTKLINVCNLTRLLVSIHSMCIFHCLALSKDNCIFKVTLLMKLQHNMIKLMHHQYSSVFLIKYIFIFFLLIFCEEQICCCVLLDEKSRLKRNKVYWLLFNVCELAWKERIQIKCVIQTEKKTYFIHLLSIQTEKKGIHKSVHPDFDLRNLQ